MHYNNSRTFEDVVEIVLQKDHSMENARTQWWVVFKTLRAFFSHVNIVREKGTQKIIIGDSNMKPNLCTSREKSKNFQP